MASSTTGIEWTDRTWNPVRGCSRISPGCVNCYAERVAARFSGPGRPFHSFADPKRSGSKWTGKVSLVPEALADPLGWKKPARVFVNSMSDLFHEDLPPWAIARVFAAMYLAPRHTFQVLTKRADRMREILSDRRFYQLVLEAAREYREKRPELTGIAISDPAKFPHRNVWLGVSVEDQKYADLRIPELLNTPAAVRFLSCEPLLGPIEFRQGTFCALPFDRGHLHLPGIDWVIVGGESGTGARPCDVSWVRSIVEQTRAAAVPCFVKQLGGVPAIADGDWRSVPALKLLSALNKDRVPPGMVPLKLGDKKGGDPAEWPDDLRVRQFPEARRG